MSETWPPHIWPEANAARADWWCDLSEAQVEQVIDYGWKHAAHNADSALVDALMAAAAGFVEIQQVDESAGRERLRDIAARCYADVRAALRTREPAGGEP